jgi:2-phosphosulfolactate phosphatase
VIDVAFTPADLRHADIAVVVDVLRATSTATQALSSGYRSVLMADTLERARELRAPNRLLAGERGCVIPPGFDLGNSPQEATRRYADELVLATTNGAPATVAATAYAPTVILACMRNLSAVVGTLGAAAADMRIQVVCSGTDGAPALEDVYVAGRICAAVGGQSTDAADVAMALAAHCADPLDALSNSANAMVLKTLGLDDDIAFCACESVLGVVPIVTGADAGIATVVAAPCSFGVMHPAPSVALLGADR